MKWLSNRVFGKLKVKLTFVTLSEKQLDNSELQCQQIFFSPIIFPLRTRMKKKIGVAQDKTCELLEMCVEGMHL